MLLVKPHFVCKMYEGTISKSLARIDVFKIGNPTVIPPKVKYKVNASLEIERSLVAMFR